MPEVAPRGVPAAPAGAFVWGGASSAVLGGRLAVVRVAAAAMPPWKLAAELARCLVLAAVVAGLAAQGGINGWAGGLALGVALWVGFPLVLWTGAMLHERVPLALAAIHAGDWLLKLLLVAAIAAVVQ